MKIFEDNDLYEQYKHLKGKVIGIEGNIGVGKSTMCNKLKNFLNKIGLEAKVFSEPVISSVLEEFIENPESSTPIFQLIMLKERKKIHRNAFKLARNKNFICIVDRTLVGDSVFAKVNRQYFNDKQWSNYLKNLQINLPPPDKIIYLHADTDTCIERMSRRDRKGEDAYSRDYIDLLNVEYAKIKYDIFIDNSKPVNIQDLLDRL